MSGDRIAYSKHQPAHFERGALGGGQGEQEGGLVEGAGQLEAAPALGDEVVDSDEDARVDPVLEVGRMELVRGAGQDRR